MISIVMSLAFLAFLQDAQTQPSASEALERLLAPQPGPVAPGSTVLPPASGGQVDATSGTGAVAPGAPTLSVRREGSYIVDRTGRLTRLPDGQWQFHFEADGRALRDPPLIVLPNLRLMSMEDALRLANRDLRFRITGMLTEYRGRNFVLIEKVIVVAE